MLIQENPCKYRQSFKRCTEVFMGDLTKEVLEAYVDTGEPM